MKHLEFEIVDMALSSKARIKRNLIIVLLFLVFIALCAIGIFLFNYEYLILILFFPFAISSYFISKKSKVLSKIGHMILNMEGVLLYNDIIKFQRKIIFSEINKMFIRGGVHVNSDVINKRSLFIDITLKTEEVITVHIGVPEFDEITAEEITEYCKALSISCSRRL